MAEKPIQPLKICRKCGGEKPATMEFFGKKRGGLTARCRSCSRADDRKRNREDANRRLYQNRLKRRLNPGLCKARDAASYRRNRAPKLEQAKRWAADNPERKRENIRDFYRRKRATDPMYRLRSSVSAYVYWCLKGHKRGRTEHLLGYSIAELKRHLDRQFAKGMSWENYGEWHVDHIVPVTVFEFENADDPQFRACWALTNLRPMWAAENIRKGGKRLHLI